MANSFVSQILEDGARNVIQKCDFYVDTADFTSTTLIDPAVLSSVGPNSQLAVDKIQFDVKDVLQINVFWDATTPVIAWRLTGRGTLNFKVIAGVINNSGAGKTGKLTFTTQGWTAAAVLVGTLFIEYHKQ